MHLLGISGSLRAVSSNTTLLRAAIELVPADATMTLYEGIGELPHFNPDLEDTAPSSVREFQHALREADGIVICSPEYAHGVPGVLKNALDWIVGSGELVDKPVLLLNASPHSTHAQASLAETLRTMAARVSGPVDVALKGKKLDAAGIVADGELSRIVREALARAFNEDAALYSARATSDER